MTQAARTPIVVAEGPLPLSVGQLPQEVTRREIVNGMKASLPINDALGVLANLHGAKPIVKRLRVLEARRNHLLACQIHEAPEPVPQKTHHPVD